MQKTRLNPILKVEEEFQADRSGRRLKHYNRQIHSLMVRTRKQLDRGMPRQQSAPLLALVEACAAAKVILPSLWNEATVTKI